jgi:sugar lactone lactonase YvrE
MRSKRYVARMNMVGRGTGFVIIGIAAAAIAIAALADNSAPAKANAWRAGAVAQNAVGRLYFLDTRGHQVMSANPDGSDVRVLAQAGGSPDGIAVDKAAGYVYWTDMGTFNPNPEGQGEGSRGWWMRRFGPGSLQRADLDGNNVTTVVPSGGTYRPKQMTIDLRDRKLYWSDREGMRVMRSNLDGSDVETLVETGQRVEGQRGDPKDYCVGIALDLADNQMYWTQRGDRSNDGSIRRASMNMPNGESPAHRTDVQVLFDQMPEPVDLALDLKTRTMYWTSDGGTGPGADTVSRAPMDPPAAYDPARRKDQQILVNGLRGGIGISLDLYHGCMFFTDLGGNVYSANLDGSDEKTLLSEMGGLTGITYVAPN